MWIGTSLCFNLWASIIRAIFVSANVKSLCKSFAHSEQIIVTCLFLIDVRVLIQVLCQIGASWISSSNLNLVFFFSPNNMSWWMKFSLSIFSFMHVHMLSHFSRVWLFDPVNGSPPGSYVRGILQARILEWVAVSSSRGLPNPGIELAAPSAPALQSDSLSLSHQGYCFLCLIWKIIASPKIIKIFSCVFFCTEVCSNQELIFCMWCRVRVKILSN